jgi:FkbM family methyltransferase
MLSTFVNTLARTTLLRPTLRTPFFQPLWSKLHRLALWGMNIGPAGTVDEGGEDWAIAWCARQTPADQPFVVIDGGANVGQYASHAIRVIGPRIRMYSFEPSPRMFARLSSRLSGEPGVRLMPFGLSDAESECELYSHAGGEAEGSLVKRDMSHWGITQNQVDVVRLRRLDDVCLEEGIRRIDLLKLDVEGHELQALRGATQLLESRSIRCIQFEFGAPDVESRTFFKDLYKLLNPNYRIYRIVHNGLTLIPAYSEFCENFATSNFLAVAR